MIWITNSLVGPEALGLLPQFLSRHDPRPAREQLHEAYAHGGGWQPFKGFELIRPRPADPASWRLQYPGDPAYQPLGYTTLRKEFVVLFEHSWVCVADADSYEIARMD